MNESFRLGPDSVYRCDGFQHFVWQRHGFGTRTASPDVAITLRQIHSDKAVNVRGLKDREKEGDALVTDEVGVSIGVRTADCVAILLLDSRQRAISAVHAGWRGSSKGVVKRAIEKMMADFNVRQGDIYAAIGPCIRGCCYEVGRDVATHFVHYSPEWPPDKEKCKLDLPKINYRQLLEAGVPEEHIFDSGLCTACQDAQFFSYRREPENPGRMVASICRLA